MTRASWILPITILAIFAGCSDDESPEPSTQTSTSGTGGSSSTTTGGMGGTMGAGAMGGMAAAGAGGQGGGGVMVNGCTRAMAIDMTAMGAITLDEWTFSHQQCVIVSVNSEVTWQTPSSFTTHPLAGGERPTSDPASPITIAASGVNGTGVMSLPVTFVAPGAYPYFCENHADMNGVVYVE